MKILAFDPSGNFEEGKGTTGACLMNKGEVKALGEIEAKENLSAEAYWTRHTTLIALNNPDHVVIEGFRLYLNKAKDQVSSQFETSQLIGALRHYCYLLKIPLTIQYASEVKGRWNDDVLVNLGILEQRGKLLYWNGRKTNTHQRDALRHALHFERYKKEKIQDETK